MAFAFSGFSPTELLEMDTEDLVWWYGQAEALSREIKANG